MFMSVPEVVLTCPYLKHLAGIPSILCSDIPVTPYSKHHPYLLDVTSGLMIPDVREIKDPGPEIGLVHAIRGWDRTCIQG